MIFFGSDPYSQGFFAPEHQTNMSKIFLKLLHNNRNFHSLCLLNKVFTFTDGSVPTVVPFGPRPEPGPASGSFRERCEFKLTRADAAAARPSSGQSATT